MTQIKPAEKLQSKSEEMLAMVQKKLGVRPNMMKTMAHSSATLEGYLNFSGALSHGALPAKQREMIALAVAQANRCDYCLAAHGALGKLAGLLPEEIEKSRNAEAINDRDAAILRFSVQLVEQKGRVSADEMESLRAQGLNDGEITEIIANVALNIFTNYFNHVSDPEIDFPKLS